MDKQEANQIIVRHRQLTPQIKAALDGEDYVAAEALCLEDIELFSRCKEAYITYYPGDPLPDYPSFGMLIDVYEQQGRFGEAVAVCNMAAHMAVPEGDEGSFMERIVMLKKRRNELSNLQFGRSADRVPSGYNTFEPQNQQSYSGTPAYGSPEPTYTPPMQEYTPEPTYTPPMQTCTPEPTYTPPMQAYTPEPTHTPPMQAYTPEPTYTPPSPVMAAGGISLDGTFALGNANPTQDAEKSAPLPPWATAEDEPAAPLPAWAIAEDEPAASRQSQRKSGQRVLKLSRKDSQSSSTVDEGAEKPLASEAAAASKDTPAFESPLEPVSYTDAYTPMNTVNAAVFTPPPVEIPPKRATEPAAVSSFSAAVPVQPETDSDPHVQDATDSYTDNYTGYSFFDGTVGGAVKCYLLGGFLCAVTLGIYTPWYLCSLQRWRLSHRVVGGRRLLFTGTGKELFLPLLLWGFLSGITLGIYSFWAAVKLERWMSERTFWELDATAYDVNPYDPNAYYGQNYGDQYAQQQYGQQPYYPGQW